VLVQKEKQKEEAEGKRLLYVATTRARDHLIIPHPSSPPQGGFWNSLAEPPFPDVELREAEGELQERERYRSNLKLLAIASGGDPVAEEWDREHVKTLEEGKTRPFAPMAVSKAAARLAPTAVPASGRPQARSFGILVHRTLELIPLGRPEDAPGLARALAPGLGLDPAAADEAAGLVQRTLALPLLERARRAKRLFRELPLLFPEGGELLEGAIDLAFEEEEGLTIVDYKTDAIGEADALDQAAHHAPQLQLYGRGLAQATALPVRERVVLFVSIGKGVNV
jgi:ATP-dependent helicase/nuclease subunit A